MTKANVTDQFPDWRRPSYDLGLWAWGYETRSLHVVKEHRPVHVKKWYRLEFEEYRDMLSGPDRGSNSSRLSIGELASGAPISRRLDGQFLRWLKSTLVDMAKLKSAPIDIVVDYSSMPRTFYGQILVQAYRNPRLVRSCTFVYTPGQHAHGFESSHSLEGLRSIIGTEGVNADDTQPAAVLGLGYDGTLAHSTIELFQIDHFSALYADPGTTEDAIARALGNNRPVIRRCEILESAPYWSVNDAKDRFLDMCNWYMGRRSVMLIPMGPKPHVLGSILAAAENPRVALRHVLTRSTPVDVLPAGEPVATRVEFLE